MKDAKIRLYVDHPLGAGQSISLTKDQAHYLFGVMRLVVGAVLLVFNGRDGEHKCEVTAAGKRGGVLTCVTETRPFAMPPDLWLMFAPIKKARTNFIVEKAVEMGASKIMPVSTDFTNSERIHLGRLQAHAVEAAEQCGATFVPEVCVMKRLGLLLDEWPADRNLMFCDEAAVMQSDQLGDAKPGPWAILIGPEGGFSESERSRLRSFEHASSVSLGPRILRAETAAVAAMTLWQSALGDWQ